MTDEKEILRDGEEMGTGAVVLPLDDETFRKFISNLLGKPQSVGKGFKGSFDVDKDAIINIHHALLQRIYQQNNGTLAKFTVKIIYDDNSSVHLNSLEEFETYNETKPVISTSVHISWTFLIQFMDKEAPEKQEVDLSFTAELGLDSDNDDADIIRFSSIRAPISSQSISFLIRHTARSWAVDIESLLTHQIEALIIRDRGLKGFVANRSTKIGLGVASLFIVSALAGATYTTSTFVGHHLDKAKEIASSGGGDYESVSNRVDFLINLVASGTWTTYAFYLTGFVIMSIILSIVFGILVGTYSSKKRPAFVLLTNMSKEKRDKALRKYSRDWSFFLCFTCRHYSSWSPFKLRIYLVIQGVIWRNLLFLKIL